MCLCVCLSVCARARLCVCEHVCVWVCMRMRASERACVVGGEVGGEDETLQPSYWRKHYLNRCEKGGIKALAKIAQPRTAGTPKIKSACLEHS